jgi:hypothetical protein
MLVSVTAVCLIAVSKMGVEAFCKASIIDTIIAPERSTLAKRPKAAKSTKTKKGPRNLADIDCPLLDRHAGERLHCLLERFERVGLLREISFTSRSSGSSRMRLSSLGEKPRDSAFSPSSWISRMTPRRISSSQREFSGIRFSARPKAL